MKAKRLLAQRRRRYQYVARQIRQHPAAAAWLDMLESSLRALAHSPIALNRDIILSLVARILNRIGRE